MCTSWESHSSSTFPAFGAPFSATAKPPYVVNAPIAFRQYRAGRAEPIKAPDDERVAGAEILDRATETRARSRCARRRVFMNDVDAGGTQRVELQCRRLFVRRDACIANQARFVDRDDLWESRDRAKRCPGAYLSPFPVVFAVRAGAVTADAGSVSVTADEFAEPSPPATCAASSSSSGMPFERDCAAVFARLPFEAKVRFHAHPPTMIRMHSSEPRDR